MGEWSEKAAFLEALALPEHERGPYLKRVCPDDAARARIETLLAHHQQAPEDYLTARAAEDTKSVPGGAMIGEFRLLHRLGEGGMGVVYLAEDTILGRRVALKLLSPRLAGYAAAAERFRDEARSAARLNHPAIVPVYKFGTFENADYIVSEFVDGPTLHAEIRRVQEDKPTGGALKAWVRKTAEIVATIADALECAHRAGIIHRDVKPSNILMDSQRGPRLTDFGVAKQFDRPSDLTQSGVVGSCFYMSPEQARIRETKVDHRTDIFSLGVVLYEMLTLRRPFNGRTVHEVLASLGTLQPRRVRALQPQVSTDLETICHKALEKRPEDRYQTAAHMAADLHCFLHGRPILARPPSFARRAKYWIFTHKVGVLGAAAILLVTLSLLLHLELRDVRNNAMAWLSVQSSEAECQLLAYRVDPTTLETASQPTWMRRLPFDHQMLEPGNYRMVVVNGDRSRFAEFNLLLPAGRGFMTTLSIASLLDSARSNSASTGNLVPGEEVLRAALLALDDPSLAGMVLIPEGTFDLGWAEKQIDPVIARKTVRLPAFHIDRYETSNREYKQFVDATGHAWPRHWKLYGYNEELADRPIVNVTVKDAEMYARWRGKRLPTMFEWEAAMRSPGGRLYPWDPDSTPSLPAVSLEDATKARSGDDKFSYEQYCEHTRPVDSDAQLATPLGIHHAASNVSELTATISTSRSNSEVRMGAPWTEPPSFYDLTRRSTAPHGSASMVIGFRCARSAQP